MHGICITGKWLGIVTDVQITHVSVAAAYAFAPAASWYSDADVPSTVRGTCPDIAKQFFSASHMYRVSPHFSQSEKNGI